MPDPIEVKISELPPASSPAGTEVLPVVQGGETRSATVDQVVIPHVADTDPHGDRAYADDAIAAALPGVETAIESTATGTSPMAAANYVLTLQSGDLKKNPRNDLAFPPRTLNLQNGGTYTFALTDVASVVGNFGVAQTYTVPTNASVAFSTGAVLWVMAIGANITLAGAGGVSLTGVTTLYPGDAALLIQSAANAWLVIHMNTERGDDVQIFTASGTWTKPTNGLFTSVEMICIGSGGAGGSGRRGAAVCGGGGGGAGATVGHVTLPWSVMTNSTESVVVGTTATGGAAVTSNDTDGNNGGNGASSWVGPAYNTAYCIGGGGYGGAKGTTTGGAGGLGGLNYFPGQFHGSDGGAGGTGAAGTVGSISRGASGGGGGGGISTGPDTAYAGAAGGPNNYTGWDAGAAGGIGAAGSVATKQAATGTEPAPGGGGGGGGSALAAAAGAGGNGARYGGGGGGGGASRNGNNSGKGGDGGPGLVVVISHR